MIWMRNPSKLMYVFLLLPLAWIVLFMLLPYCIILVYSFWIQKFPTFVPAFQLGNYVQVFINPQYFRVVLRSGLIATQVSIFSLLLAFPFAYYLVFKSVRIVCVWHSMWLSLCRFGYPTFFAPIRGKPFWQRRHPQFISGVVRHAVCPHGYLPLQPVRHGFDHDLYLYPLYGHADLHGAGENSPQSCGGFGRSGVGPAGTFWKVIWPLSIPGVIAGATFTFCLSLGDFIAPILVGGARWHDDCQSHHLAIWNSPQLAARFCAEHGAAGYRAGDYRIVQSRVVFRPHCPGVSHVSFIQSNQPRRNHG